MLTLELTPGTSLGPFYLGMPISETLARLVHYNKQHFSRQIAKIEILYNAVSPLSQDVVIHLVEDGMVFKFEPSTQRLKMLEVHDLDKVRLMYGNFCFTGPSVDSSFVRIYQVFGPTYPGSFNKEEMLYYLSYPGLTFVFPIPQQFAKRYENSEELPMEFPNGTTPIAIKIFLFQGLDFSNPTLPAIVADEPPMESGSGNGSEGSEVNKTRAQQLSITTPQQLLPTSLYFEKVQVTLGKSIRFTKRDRTIYFHDSPQQVIMQLGAPDHIFFKRHDKLRIHAIPKALPDSHDYQMRTGFRNVVGFQKTAVDYFYNYFSLGVDIMFNGCTHTVHKIVFHTNFPGSKDFNMYTKCNFAIPMENEQGASNIITQDMKFSEIQQCVGDGKMSKPLVNDSTVSNNPFGGTRFFASDGCIFEVLKNDYLNSVTLFVV